MGIGSETIMGTEIEQEECDAKWNGMGIGDGEHETNKYRKHETCGGTESGTGI